MKELNAKDVYALTARLQAAVTVLPKEVQEDFNTFVEILAAGMLDTCLLNFLELHPCQAQIRGGPDDGAVLISWAIATAKGGSLRQAITDYFNLLKQQEKEAHERQQPY